MSSASRRAFFALMAGSGGEPFAIVGLFPRAVAGVPYDETLDLVGPYSAPVVVDLADGAVPVGLTLEIDVTGTKARLHGTPTGLIRIDGTLPPAVVGFAYSARLQVIGAAGAVTVDISAGALPAWASLVWHSDTQEIEVTGMPS